MPVPPYGWRRDRGQLVPVPAEQAVRWLVLHLKREGWTLDRISAELDTLAIRRGGQRIPRATLHRVIQRGGFDLADTG